MERAQWRFSGETDLDWKDSGETVGDLVTGNYLVECKLLNGRVTPATAGIVLGEDESRTVTLTYFIEDPTVGAGPGLLSFETVTQGGDEPFQWVGQIRSEVGSSSGFVVKPRVVATAGHVVFNEETLAGQAGIQWLFQRDRGNHEPKPIEPRGYYLFDGYAASRQEPGVIPGEGTVESQHHDVAALYFLENAGRGGASGFLASDSDDNEFLTSTANKILVGYPVDRIQLSRQGRMHATAPFDVNFTRVPGEVSPGVAFRTYTTEDVFSRGGGSGGPLCVQFEGGIYYPAAVYLGGSGQTVVRAIDSDVIELFDRAETSGNSGGRRISELPKTLVTPPTAKIPTRTAQATSTNTPLAPTRTIRTTS